MYKRRFFLGLGLSLYVSLTGTVWGQTGNPDEVRRTFLATRGTSQVAGVRFSKRDSRSSGSSGGGIASGNSGGGFGRGSRGISNRVGGMISRKPPVDSAPAPTSGMPPTKEATPATTVAAEPPAAGLGLGYTLFQKAADGTAVRSMPTHSFTSDEKVRIWLEPSADGYLYVFAASAAGAPLLLYPSSDLNAGRNLVYAHFPVEWPFMSDAAGNDNQWMQFPAKPGKSTFYVVLAKEPLAGLPVGKKLADYCAQNKDAEGKCQVDKKVWAGIAALDQPDKLQTAETGEGSQQKQMPVELALTLLARGYGLTAEEPVPAVIFMNTDAARGVLFAKLEVSHK